jgi:hypothetical protein
LAADFELWARFYQCADLYGLATPLAGFRRHSNQKTYHQLAEYIKEAREALVRHGGGPRGRLASVPSRLYGHLPERLKPMAIGLGLVRPAKACRYFDPGGWKVVSV